MSLGSNLERVEFNPCIVALAGPPYSGKTSTGQALESVTNFNFIDINNGRWLFDQDGEEFKNPLVRSMAMTESYALAHYLAAQCLVKDEPVLLAATYSHHSYVNMLRAFADLNRRLTKSPESTLRIFVLNAPEDSYPRRCEERRLRGDEKFFPYIPLERALELKKGFVPITGTDVVPIDTGLPLEETVKQILTELEPFRRR